jgi:cytochrome subunit of sulfide dehydrogenase
MAGPGLLLTGMLIAVAAGDAAAGPSAEAVARTCTVCHAAAAARTVAVPALDNIEPAALRQVLLAYKNGSRRGTIMSRVVEGHDEATLAAVADLVGRH